MVRTGGELIPFPSPDNCASTLPMNGQPKATQRKRPGPAPTGKGVTIGTRLQPDLLQAIDRLIAERGHTLTRAGAIRAVLSEYFGLTLDKSK